MLNLNLKKLRIEMYILWLHILETSSTVKLQDVVLTAPLPLDNLWIFHYQNSDISTFFVYGCCMALYNPECQTVALYSILL